MAADEDTSSNLEYEANENGERVLVRSTASNLRVYLRFTNKTRRPVNVWWHDYTGKPQFYVRLDTDTYYDINSFVTHPWHFSDATTNERYVINNNPIYRAPATIGGMMYRTNWNITIGVRSLRATVLLSLAKVFRDPSAVDALGLPRLLGEELQNQIIGIHREPTPPTNP